MQYLDKLFPIRAKHRTEKNKREKEMYLTQAVSLATLSFLSCIIASIILTIKIYTYIA